MKKLEDNKVFTPRCGMTGTLRHINDYHLTVSRTGHLMNKRLLRGRRNDSPILVSPFHDYVKTILTLKKGRL